MITQLNLSNIWQDRNSFGITGSGAFIVLEGIDGSGKTTQAELLVRRMERIGLKVIKTSEPSEGPIGRSIRSLSSPISPHEEAHLFAEDRRYHVEQVIVPALNAGAHVVSDRYLHSSLAYQGARGASLERILEWNEKIALKPDTIFFMEIPIDMALLRIKAGRNDGFSIYETLENLKAVDQIYRSIKDPLIVRIDATLSITLTHNAIVDALCMRRIFHGL
jgi:dTMP kinase